MTKYFFTDVPTSNIMTDHQCFLSSQHRWKDGTQCFMHKEFYNEPVTRTSL